MTVQTPAQRFFAPEVSVYRWLPTVADLKAGATRAEIDAGVLLIDMADIAGWNATVADIATPDMQSRWVSNIPGRKTAEASSITFYASLDGKDVREILAEGDNGVMFIADGGDEPSYLYDLFPARVSNIGKVRSVGDQAFQLTVGFSLTKPPVTDLVVPAAAP